ncbi:hypothetical protein OsJ_30600 [Oryza sativa Japonica Group]|uniref:Uncharacterized protein n=1 Tax=Oryza sativa subsp. japonica TaxID=39947 RepID=B9G7C5_ORYSJ|nr:hypothetical protein OsJ_30600 [Oryza sativa Japonica Group]
MAMMNRTRDLLMEGFEGLVREGSFSWALPRRGASPVDDADDPDSSSSSSSGKQPSISGLSPKANAVVSRCSRVLGTSTDELQYDFDMQASDSIKQPRNYARNFLEYCCLRALAHASQVAGYLSDKSFRRLNFDMMLAWEVPSSSSELTVKVEVDNTVSLEAFSRIAPAIPTITDVVTCSNLFDVLSSSSGGRLTFPVYDKYLTGLDRAIKKMKGQSESSLLSAQRSQRGERIVEVDGTLTTQPVLEHVGISTWPGRLTLTDHALYFEALRVVTYDKPKAYELAEDLKQTEPVIIEFPELAGHFRRDYWLAIISEILYVHRFVRKFDISGVDKEETILKAVLSIMRLQAIEELAIPVSNRFESLLMFNLCDKLPGGDVILETLAGSISSRRSTQVNQPGTSSGRHSMSPFTVLSNLGVVSPINKGERLFVGEIVVGEMSALQKVVNESMNNYKKVELAQATVDGVKVDGLDTNLAVMKVYSQQN